MIIFYAIYTYTFVYVYDYDIKRPLIYAGSYKKALKWYKHYSKAIWGS